jgi:polyisoprenoid-binding protein YceI
MNIAQSNHEVQKITWIGKAAVGGYAPEGSLQILNASATVENDKITSLRIVIDMKTLEQENKQLRDHLRQEDFFHVERFPVATFILTKPISIESEQTELIGEMTIRGKTNTEEIPSTIAYSKGAILIDFSHTMDRTKYGVNYNSPSIFKRIKENAIADEFILKGNITIRL